MPKNPKNLPIEDLTGFVFRDVKNLSKENLRYRWGPVVFGEVTYGPGGACGPRVQQDYQLIVMHRGMLELCLDDQKILVAGGQAILLAPGHRVYQQFTADAETHHSWCAIAAKAVPAALCDVISALTSPIPFGGHLAALLDAGKLMSHSRTASQLLEKGSSLALALALFWEFTREAELGGLHAKTGDAALAKLERFVSIQYAKPLKLSDLAVAAGVSPQHLMRLFRARGTVTPMEYLYKKRAEAAAELLSHTGLSVGEIADRSGFGDVFHFSRKFRKVYGASPREWRARLWNPAQANPEP